MKFISAKYMKIRILILLCVGLASIFPAKAQLDAHLLGYVDSTEIILNNGRRLVYQSLAEGNFTKAQEVYDYLTKEAEKRLCFAFNLNEDLYINLLLTNWNNWFALARTYDEQLSKSACYNFSENYVERLFKLTQKHQQRIKEELRNQNLFVDESELIELYFQLIYNTELDQLYISRYKAFEKNILNPCTANFLSVIFQNLPLNQPSVLAWDPLL